MNRREKILALVIVGLAALFAVDRLIVAPLTEAFAALDEQTTQLESDLTEAQVMIRSQDKIQRRWTDYRDAGLKSQIDAARIRVQVHVTEWSAASRFQVSTLSSGRVVPGDTYDRLTFAVSGSGTLRQVHAFLYALQSAGFPLRVTDCTISRRSDEGDQLSVSLNLSTIVESAAAENERMALATGGRP